MTQVLSRTQTNRSASAASAATVSFRQRRNLGQVAATPKNLARGCRMETLDLSGRKGLVVGIAIEESLAWSATKHEGMVFH